MENCPRLSVRPTRSKGNVVNAESAKLACNPTRRTVEIRTQAPDHPALLNEEETQYLKCFVLQVL